MRKKSMNLRAVLCSAALSRTRIRKLPGFARNPATLPATTLLPAERMLQGLLLRLQPGHVQHGMDFAFAVRHLEQVAVHADRPSVRAVIL